jgi:hypothetical protein
MTMMMAYYSNLMAMPLDSMAYLKNNDDNARRCYLCSAVQCSAVQCSAVQCSAVQCSAVQCRAVQCSAVQCSAVQCSAVQCSAVFIKLSPKRFLEPIT